MGEWREPQLPSPDGTLAVMPHHANRPTKTCPICGRPFQWRKKWKAVWDEVRYCSERCRRDARRREQEQTP
jgi:hypothetical protein